MLVFITPIRHPHVSNNYDKIENLLAQTLRSVCGQTDGDFRVVVVCNQVPKFTHKFEKVDFLKVEFEPTRRVEGRIKPNSKPVIRDKGTKFIAGILYAEKKYSPDYVMFFDGDDLVSNKIAAYVNSFKNENGWYIKQGYLHEDGMVNMKLKEDFYLACGTSHIMNPKLLNIPDEIPDNPTQDDILSHPAANKISEILGDHSKTKAYFDVMGNPLKPLPFPGAIWMVNHGENTSVKKGISALMGSPISQSNREEFMLQVKDFSISDYVYYCLRWPEAVLISLKLLIFRDFYYGSRKFFKRLMLRFLQLKH